MNPNDFSIPFGTEQIQRCIPHRYPFLLVDRIIEYDPEKSLIGIKNVSITDPYLQGHFPGNPIMPGVLQIEAIAQVAAIFGKLVSPHLQNTLLTEVESTRFRRLVVPGDTLRLEVYCLKRRQTFFWFEGIAKVDDEISATMKFSAKLS